MPPIVQIIRIMMERFLGYGPGDADRLPFELLDVIGSFPPISSRPANHPAGATQYAVEGVIGGPNGRQAAIRTGWQIDTPDSDPYLVTAYLLGRLRTEGQ